MKHVPIVKTGHRNSVHNLSVKIIFTAEIGVPIVEGFDFAHVGNVWGGCSGLHWGGFGLLFVF